MGPAGFEPAACGLADNGFIPIRLHFDVKTEELNSAIHSVR
jgi:hypothetical protein